jgi:uncharacterized membrane protein YfcA
MPPIETILPQSLLISFETTLFLIGTFVAALVTGLSGFAFGLVAAAIWLQALTPLQTTSLIVAYALLVQGYAVWRLRRKIVPSRVLPFIVGSAIGVPIGVLALKWLSALHLKLGIAVLLILFSLYSLARPKMPSVAWAGRTGDSITGVLNGIVGGSTGLAGILPVIWSGIRGWKPEEQRAVFQPTAIATFLMCLVALGGTDVITSDTVWLFAIGLPALLLGTIAGWSLFGKLDEAWFRRVVLWLLLACGVAMLATTGIVSNLGQQGR